MLPENATARRLPGTDGKEKMSKSLGNCIYLSDSAADVWKKVKKMSNGEPRMSMDEPGHLEGNAVFTYLEAFSTDDSFAEFWPEFKTLDELKEHYVHGAHKVTYHDSCHMRRGLGIYKEPRALLDSIPNVDFVEMKNPDKCCGMAGAFGVKYSEISLPMLQEKIQNIKDTGADTIAVACPACMMQIGGGLDKQAPNIKIRHVADILAEELHK